MMAPSGRTVGRLIRNIPAQNNGGGGRNYFRYSPNRRQQKTSLRLRKKPMKSRSYKNSTTAAVAGFQGAIEPIPMPEGVTLRSAEEHIIWGQFTRARAREDWRDMDLLLLAKVVRMEADIRKHQTVLDRKRPVSPTLLASLPS